MPFALRPDMDLGLLKILVSFGLLAALIGWQIYSSSRDVDDDGKS